MLIVSRGVTVESIGRISMKIDSMKQEVTITTRNPNGVIDQSELDIVKKYLRYHHPEIINKAGIMTGWKLTGTLAFGFPE